MTLTFEGHFELKVKHISDTKYDMPKSKTAVCGGKIDYMFIRRCFRNYLQLFNLTMVNSAGVMKQSVNFN